MTMAQRTSDFRVVQGSHPKLAFLQSQIDFSKLRIATCDSNRYALVLKENIISFFLNIT